MENRKSLKFNIFLNSFNNVLGIIFPLITFPYASRVLGVENIGRYNFGNAFVNYFALIAALGISEYIVREGAKVRNNKAEFTKIADEVFSINILSTAAAYIALMAVCLMISRVKDYYSIIMILSLAIFFSTISVNWIYTIYEDYLYLTLRSIAFRIMSLVLMLIFVKDSGDLLIYCGTSVISRVILGVYNYITVKKYYRPKLIINLKKINLKKHIPPIAVLFASQIATTIYVNSDITVLGLICGDYSVGIYSVAVRIYHVVKTILSAVIITAIPRLSAQLGQNRLDEFKKTASEVYGLLITFLFPAITGIILLRKEIVLFISGYEYIQAVCPLAILVFALIFSIFGWFWGHCILVPMDKEKTVLYATVAAAVVNLVLNLAIVPLWKENAAAFTTVVAEFVQCAIVIIIGHKYIKLDGSIECIAKTAAGCLGIILTEKILRFAQLNNIIHLVVTIIISVIVFIVIEILLKNTAITDLTKRNKKNINN